MGEKHEQAQGEGEDNGGEGGIKTESGEGSATDEDPHPGSIGREVGWVQPGTKALLNLIADGEASIGDFPTGAGNVADDAPGLPNGDQRAVVAESIIGVGETEKILKPSGGFEPLPKDGDLDGRPFNSGVGGGVVGIVSFGPGLLGQVAPPHQSFFGESLRRLEI